MNPLSLANLISLVPLLLYGAAIIAAAMWLLALQRRSDQFSRRMATLEETANAALNEFQGQLDAIRRGLAALEERPIVSSNPGKPGLTLSNRAQVLRMLRRGMSADAVAASLKLPRPEIELLIRIQEMSAAAEGPTFEPPAG